jgi:hypothetical protein
MLVEQLRNVMPLIPILFAVVSLLLRRRWILAVSRHPKGDDPFGSGLLRHNVYRFRSVMFLLTLGLSWFAITSWAAHGGFREIGEAIELRAYPAAWIGPAGFLALGISSLIQDAYFSRHGPTVYPLATNTVSRDTRLADPTWQVLLAYGLASLAILQLQNFYVIVSPARFSIGPLFRMTERGYSYDQVTFVRTAPKFERSIGSGFILGPSISIGFKDGSQWTTKDDGDVPLAVDLL